VEYEAKYERLQVLKKFYRSVGLFGKLCFPTALKKETPAFHNEVYDTVRNPENDRVLIAAPRGTAKSTVCSLILPLWYTAFKREDEDLFIVIISESQTQSINFLSRIKYHLDHSDVFRDMFGDMGSSTAMRWTNNDVILANGARIIAVGTGQRVRGFIEGDTRPNLIIVDDFESELNANTPEARVKNRKWMTEAVIPSLSDEGRLVMVGTVISEDCFLNWGKSSSRWTTLWYSIIDDDGESIWPERFPLKRIEEIKEEFTSVGNLNGFYQEYMNIAQAPDTAPFKPHYMRTHDYEYKRVDGYNYLSRQRGDEEELKPVDIYMGIDPASSLSLRADYFVIAVIAVDYDNVKYVVDIIRGRFDPAEQPDKIISAFKKYHPQRTKIETVAYQEALRSAVRKQMIDQNLYIPGLESGVKPRGNKSERLLSLVPMLAKNEFYFRPSDVQAQQEFLSYPKGRHDDIMDAIWTALDKAMPCRIDKVKNTTKKNIAKKVIDWMTM